MDLPGFICLGSFWRARIIRSDRRRARRRKGGAKFSNGIHKYFLFLCVLFFFVLFCVLQLTLMTLKPKLRFASTPAMRLLPNIPSNGSSISIFCKQNRGRGQCGQSNEKCCSILFCAVLPFVFSVQKKRSTTHGGNHSRSSRSTLLRSIQCLARFLVTANGYSARTLVSLRSLYTKLALSVRLCLLFVFCISI